MPPFGSPAEPYVVAHRTVGRIPRHFVLVDQPPGDYIEAPMEAIALTGADAPVHGRLDFGAGSPPHRYLIERRVARVRECLEHGSDPIVDIALDCGFSSEARMTSTFVRQLGMSPARDRKERKR